MTITIDQPGKPLKVEVPDCIGKFFVIACTKGTGQFVANCIDATPDGKPKRMRIQFDPVRQGEVLQPHQYQIMEEHPDVDE